MTVLAGVRCSHCARLQRSFFYLQGDTVCHWDCAQRISQVHGISDIRYDHSYVPADHLHGDEASRQTGRQASGQASRQAGKQAGRQAGKQAEKQARQVKARQARNISRDMTLKR